MFKLNSWRLADVLTMALLAIPLVGCSDALGDPRHARQSRPVSSRVAPDAADGEKEATVMNTDVGASPQLIQAELRHFHVYQNYRAVIDAMEEPAMQKPASQPEEDARLQRAVMTFSARNLEQALGDCSRRAMLLLD